MYIKHITLQLLPFNKNTIHPRKFTPHPDIRIKIKNAVTVPADMKIIMHVKIGRRESKQKGDSS
jgi:hypothetical protein